MPSFGKSCGRDVWKRFIAESSSLDEGLLSGLLMMAVKEIVRLAANAVNLQSANGQTGDLSYFDAGSDVWRALTSGRLPLLSG